MKRLLKIAGIVTVMVAIPALVAAMHVVVASWGRLHGLEDVPPRRFALVLGARAYPDRPSAFLAARLDLAAELLRDGKIEKIIVSGDGRDDVHNEPRVMRDYLVGHHRIPADLILEDPGGYDTYDSCVRARTEFGVDGVILTSQDFHVRRAIAICRGVGVDGVAVANNGPRQRRSRDWVRGWLREPFANLKMEWDLLSGRKPAIDDE